MRKISSVLIFWVILCCFAGPALAGELSSHEREAIALLNKERAAHSLPPLQADRRLMEIGRAHAKEMSDKGYFSHTNKKGEAPFERLKKAGVGYRAAGENIAAGFSVKAAQADLMNNPVYRKNVLNKEFDRVGVGVAPKQGGQLYVVQIFIKAAPHPLYERERYD